MTLSGDALHDLAGLLIVSLAGDVCLRHDPDKPAALLDHRDAADLMLSHQVQRLV